MSSFVLGFNWNLIGCLKFFRQDWVVLRKEQGCMDPGSSHSHGHRMVGRQEVQVQEPSTPKQPEPLPRFVSSKNKSILFNFVKILQNVTNWIKTQNCEKNKQFDNLTLKKCFVIFFVFQEYFKTKFTVSNPTVKDMFFAQKQQNCI